MLAADILKAALGGFVPPMQRDLFLVLGVIGAYWGPPRIDAG
jgi:hypothetical protein